MPTEQYKFFRFFIAQLRDNITAHAKELKRFGPANANAKLTYLADSLSLSQHLELLSQSDLFTTRLIEHYFPAPIINSLGGSQGLLDLPTIALPKMWQKKLEGGYPCLPPAIMPLRINIVMSLLEGYRPIIALRLHCLKHGVRPRIISFVAPRYNGPGCPKPAPNKWVVTCYPREGVVFNNQHCDQTHFNAFNALLQGELIELDQDGLLFGFQHRVLSRRTSQQNSIPFLLPKRRRSSIASEKVRRNQEKVNNQRCRIV